MILWQGSGYYMGVEPEIVALYNLARALHEAGRPAVEAGETMAAALGAEGETPILLPVRVFVEWADLPPRVRHGRLLTACHLAAGLIMGESVPPGATRISGAALAREIHNSEPSAYHFGLTLRPIGVPWLNYDNLPDAARAGRLRQAEALEAAGWRAWVWDK